MKLFNLLSSKNIEPEQKAITEEEQIKDLLYQFYEFCQEGGFEIRGIKKELFSESYVRFALVAEDK